ncbi:unnamed protein product [Phytophthora fragariaefolia]|uniref:Unnamed protein product n=1 Tax=Phytophthora fragariaefolia TaxID=1490495 RepID=A0A9W6U0T4_9STRA|nr:unnamed protein product [Phytophthora fragariaefolia]
MRTSFAFEVDKELVLLVHTSSCSGSQTSWSDVVRRMRRSGHQVSVLKKRPLSLKRTWGPDPRSLSQKLFTPVYRPRGRRPAMIRQLRAAPPPPQNKLSNHAACLPVVEFLICDLTTEASELSAGHIDSAATADAPGSPGDIELSSRAKSISASVADGEVVQASSPLSSSTGGEATVIQGVPPLLSFGVVDLAAIFADVPRQLGMQTRMNLIAMLRS